ncbi:IS481 family transposase [Desulfovibrio sulfodismutans]|uniref:IS481 family transposase n=1 Tax=Desulfolutivibrio sulfodismutans TaxID=63561 RepID=A0A7K3NTA4_9BACT|nr:IS481 family transposase [Desulfolutivibrio sulfodismutans]NDY59015.1 IS481 family transposase [Desulfolutivibrio sulfodismutans]QLA12628.1 IS481 family transposase [Desulfolutivibrio sulfodismutans DSM 3696]QLA12924.1 IS481 family transposase [Desulfolutivibrio sulfodismutans DSM 3696]
MKAEEKLARQRLSVLELAKELGNIAEACRQRGMHRSQFYEYKRRFQTHGIEGLKDLPPIPKSHPMTTPDEVVQRILAFSLDHPAWGCVRLSNTLKLDGISVSSPTIQNILIKNGMASKYDRWLKLEEKRAGEPIELTGEQVAFIERQNPAFRERHVESSRPGELLCQDTYYVGRLKGVGRVYMHTVVDTYSSYGFGFLHTAKVPEAAVAVLHNDVLPFYQEKNLSISSLLTDNGREYCGTESHPYELYLELSDIEHRRTKIRSPRTNGFVERFHRTALDEFYREAFRSTLYESVESLQADLDDWLDDYNNNRPHQGYRNMGRRPIDTINQYLENVQ